MSASSRNGATRAQSRLTDAGDAEADSMIGRFGRIARMPWLAAVKLLAVLLLVVAPGSSLARPRTIEEPPSLDGDPTADDQPSPSPKGGNNGAGSISGHQRVTTKDGTGRLARERHVRLALQAYLRLIARISLR